MDEHSQRLAVPVDHRGRAAGRGTGDLQRTPGGVHEGSGFGQPVADLQARVAERTGKLVAENAGAGLAELDDQIGPLGALPRPAQQAEQETGRQGAVS